MRLGCRYRPGRFTVTLRELRNPSKACRLLEALQSVGSPIGTLRIRNAHSGDGMTGDHGNGCRDRFPLPPACRAESGSVSATGVWQQNFSACSDSSTVTRISGLSSQCCPDDHPAADSDCQPDRELTRRNARNCPEDRPESKPHGDSQCEFVTFVFGHTVCLVCLGQSVA
jgi:hypothetical protein